MYGQRICIERMRRVRLSDVKPDLYRKTRAHAIYIYGDAVPPPRHEPIFGQKEKRTASRVLARGIPWPKDVQKQKYVYNKLNKPMTK